MKWVKVRNKKEWACDACRTCGDNACCSTPAKWIKHPNVYPPKTFRFRYEGSLGDLALCDKCFDANHERLVKEFMENEE
jgi:hypothetical protein